MYEMESKQGFNFPSLRFEFFEKENILAIGLDDGCLAIFDLKSKLKKSNFDKKDPILFLDWDHHSPDYLLLGHKNGEILLVDSDKMVLLQAFEKMATGIIFIICFPNNNIKFLIGISALAWIKGIPGGFLTTTEKLSTLKIWSVSGRFFFFNFKFFILLLTKSPTFNFKNRIPTNS